MSDPVSITLVGIGISALFIGFLWYIFIDEDLETEEQRKERLEREEKIKNKYRKKNHY